MPPRPDNGQERRLGERPDFDSWLGEVTETLDARRDRAGMSVETPPAGPRRRGSVLAGLRRLLAAR